MIRNHKIKPLTSVKNLIVLFLTLELILCSCGLKPSEPAKATVEVPAVTETPVPVEPTTLPSPTQKPNLVILLSSGVSDPELASSVEKVIGELAAKDGLDFETRSEIVDMQLQPGVRLVVALPPDLGLANLAAANPEVQFLAIGIAGMQPATNLSLIGGSGSGPDQIGFLAGYLAGVITSDWRVGVISPAGSVEGKTAALAFKNGVIFFCGLCRPAYPPFVQYPYTIELTTGAGEAELLTVADQLTVNGVKTLFLAPGIDPAAIAKALSSAGVKYIGASSPPEEIKSDWIATIQFDPANTIRQIWPMLVEGQGGLSESASLAIGDVNPDLLSQGRLQWVEKMLSDLEGGYIDTGVDPQTGELR